MRIAFVGNVASSRRVLEALLDRDAGVVGVLTRRDSSFNSDHVDLGPLAASRGIPFAHQEDMEADATAAWIEALVPDVVFCIGWSRLLPPRILSAAPLGVVGFHPSPLPRGRGRHPIVWALALGLEETASTFFRMDEGADTGALLSQERIAILPDDDAGSLYDRICRTACSQAVALAEALAEGRAEAVEQDGSRATVWRRRTERDGRIDWRMPARGIVDLVRALARPYPGAHIETDSGALKAWKAAVLPEESDPTLVPGLVTGRAEDGSWFDVRCADGVVRVLSHEGGDGAPRRGEWLP